MIVERGPRTPLSLVPSTLHRVFRPTQAFRHDSSHCLLPSPHSVCDPAPALKPDHVAAEWALMYHWLDRDPRIVALCGFEDSDLSSAGKVGRISDLRAEIALTGMFSVREAEMQFWVRFAWASADRCSGRQHALQQAVIRYLPHVRTAPDMLRAIVEHAEVAMRPALAPQAVITVTGGPAKPGALNQCFVTQQLVRYEGDPAYRGLVDWLDARDLGLIQRVEHISSRFTVLPMIAIGEDGDIAVGTAPVEQHYPVYIPSPRHPDEGEDAAYDFADRIALWTAIPLQTNFTLDIAGQRYCVAFNGSYVDEEVVIDLLDPQRYDLASAVAQAIFDDSVARLDEYRISQIEVATLWAVRAGFRRARARISKLGASQGGFAKFREHYLADHGEEPPNDPAWTANRLLSRYRTASHPMPLVRQTRGARLAHAWLTHQSICEGAHLEVVNL